MTDHSVKADGESPRAGVPDYDLPDALPLTDPEQYGALFEPTREQIVGILLERAATTSELAELLDRPKGTIGHHLKVLESAGLVRVVRTKRVRALEAKYYGRTARVFYFDRLDEAVGSSQRVLERAAAEFAAADAARRGREEDATPVVIDANRRDVRVSADQALEFQRRLAALLLEFADAPRSGETTYAMTYAIYPTDRPALRADDQD